MEWLEKHFHYRDGFPRPHWEAIYSEVEDFHNDTDHHELWCSIARAWATKLATALPGKYAIHESENFILLTSESGRYVSLFQGFLERTLKRILSTLRGIASDDGLGKYVVLIFDDIDAYYSYISDFYPKDGIYALSSGTYLNRGFGHFVFPHQELSYAESIAAHEMTHALLAHLPIPAWLNEGMAVNMENEITGSAPLRMDNELYARHQSFWGEQEIQEFWSGDSFHRPDEGQELSYQLAQFAVQSLSQDYEAFAEFANAANESDGGESAAHNVFEGSLGNLISKYFGEGEWSPRPATWADSHSSSVAQIDAAEPRG
jgi:hypothetical protein